MHRNHRSGITTQLFELIWGGGGHLALISNGLGVRQVSIISCTSTFGPIVAGDLDSVASLDTFSDIFGVWDLFTTTESTGFVIRLWQCLEAMASYREVNVISRQGFGK